MRDIDWNRYYHNVSLDYRELREQYPYCYLTILPTVEPKLATIRVVAANKDLIEMTGAVESDFIGEYSRELHIEIPMDYKRTGCKVYGAKWVDIDRFDDRDRHFYHCDHRDPRGYELCVGLPESFPLMKNVILENVRTAENMLIAYERVMTGVSENLELIAYAHGDAGKKQFQHNRLRYIPEE